jgi:hypothetical protein
LASTGPPAAEWAIFWLARAAVVSAGVVLVGAYGQIVDAVAIQVADRSDRVTEVIAA